MYLTNKYTTWYYNIIAKAKIRVKTNEYLEVHHIIPKSLGGRNEFDNLVELTAKEHFICHRLLVKMTTGTAKKSMAFAIWQMSSLNNKVSKNRYKPSSRIYAILKKQLSDSCKGVRLSEEHKAKMRKPKSEEHKAKLRKPKSEEHKKAIAAARLGKTFGYTHSIETREKIRKSNTGKSGTFKGRTHSEETKQRMAAARLEYWKNKHN